MYLQFPICVIEVTQCCIALIFTYAAKFIKLKNIILREYIIHEEIELPPATFMKSSPVALYTSIYRFPM